MRDTVYFTSLVHAACRSGSLPCVEYLVSEGAMLEHVDLVGDTALHHAVAAGDKGLAVAKYLLTVSVVCVCGCGCCSLWLCLMYRSFHVY